MLAERRKRLDYCDRLNADADNLADQADDVAGIVLAVRIGVAFDLVLFHDPFEGRAVAEPVVERFGRDAAQGEGFVYADGALVLAELHLGNTFRIRNGLIFDMFEGPRIERLVFEVKAREFFPRGSERVEVGCEGDAREFTFQVSGVAFAVIGVMKERVDVVKIESLMIVWSS